MSKQNYAVNAKLKICMFGDGDIIGTTKKKPRKIEAFDGLTRISNLNFYVERV